MDADEMFEMLLDKRDNLLLTLERKKDENVRLRDELRMANKKCDELRLAITNLTQERKEQ